MLKIGVLLGDDIGLEVVPECVKVIKASAARTGLAIDWRALPIGRRGHEEHGDTLPAVTEQALHELDGWIMGPIGHAAYPRNDRTWVMPHKESVYRLACGRFAEECRKVAREYPDVAFDEVLIDTISMRLVVAPQQFDVVVTTNQFGDTLTDIGAGLAGGLGLAPGLCVGERQAMAQATHGSAPDIAGRNIANPYAMIMPGQMLVAWLGRKRGEPRRRRQPSTSRQRWSASWPRRSI